jgi:hypothetical protein
VYSITICTFMKDTTRKNHCVELTLTTVSYATVIHQIKAVVQGHYVVSRNLFIVLQRLFV